MKEIVMSLIYGFSAAMLSQILEIKPFSKRWWIFLLSFTTAIVSSSLLTIGNCKADPYVAIGQGVSKFEIDQYYISGIQSIDNATKPVSHIAIGYSWDDWAIELGHESFGAFGYRAFKPSEGQINAQIEAETFYVAGKRYFGPFYGMLGVQKWYTDADISRSVAGTLRYHISGTNGVFGAGYQFSIFDHLSLDVSYTKFMGIGNQSLIGSKTDAGVVGLAVVIQ